MSPLTKTAVKALIAFSVFTPLLIFVLFAIKGLPSFALGHKSDVLFYVYQAGGLPTFIAGVFLALVLKGLEPRIGFFAMPYDVGRCVSLGTIIGAILEPLSIWVYGMLGRHLYSSFWIASAAIAGAIAGGTIVPLVFRGWSRKIVAAL